MEKKIQHIKKEYDYYTKNISPDNMAMSLNLALFMYDLCNLYKFESLMDRGSGFSSFVLRKYAQEQDFPVTVFSVDSNKKWLEKTREYLIRNDLPLDHIYSWNEFYKKYKGKIKFDFILEDAITRLRKNTPNELTSFSKGMILWDDYHTKYHKQIVKDQCIRRNMEIIDIKDVTLDKYGRYGVLTKGA